MKLLSVQVARSIWLFQMTDWNPRGRDMQPIFSYLINQYNFLKFPKVNEIDWQKGIKFEDGKFKTQAGEEILITLTAYADGVIVDTRSSTKDADEFLEQALSFFTVEFNYPEYQSILRKKLYSSEFQVKLDRDLTAINTKLPKFVSLMSALATDDSAPFRIGFSLLSDPALGRASIDFKLEPAAGFPFSENRYYSHASLQTDAHFHLLEEFESNFLA